METNTQNMITVEATVHAPVEKVWQCWNDPKHIMQWCFAMDDTWHAPYAENDARTGGRFKTTMAAKDGSVSFDFEGVYDEVIPLQKMAYTLTDQRRVFITFTQQGKDTFVRESFNPESLHDPEMQRGGWQAILNNFKSYTEKNI